MIVNHDRDGLYDYLINDLGLTSNTVEDCLYEYFVGEGYSGALPDMEYDWLTAKGYTTGTTADRWYAYLIDKGYSGSLSDMFKAAIGNDDLLEGSNPISWLLSFNLNGTATIPNDSSGDVTDGFADTTPRYPRTWTSSGLVLSEVYGPAFISEGMRISYDTTEDGVTLGSDVTIGSNWESTLDFTGTQLFYNKVGLSAVPYTYQVSVVVSNYVGTSISFQVTTVTKITITGNGLYTWDGTLSNLDTIKFAGATGDADLDITIKQITPAFLNSVSSSDSTKLHPSKTDATNGNEVMLQFDYWQASTAYSLGDKVYVIGTDNHNYALTCSTAGTSGGTIPSVATADIGSTKADNTAVWDVDHYYSNLATASQNAIPFVWNEPVGVNQCAESRDFSTTWVSVNTTSKTQDQIGIDGVANKAWTLGDADGSSNAYFRYPLSVSVDSNTHAFKGHIGVDTDETRYPCIAVDISGGTTVSQGWIINTKTGDTLALASNTGSGAFTLKRFNSNFWEWELTITNNNTAGNTALNIYQQPARTNVWTDGSQVGSVTGTAVFDWVDARLNSSTVDSLIFTDGGSEQRDATDYTATNFLPANGFQIRGRFVYRNSSDLTPYILADQKDGSNYFIVYYTHSNGRVTAQVDTALAAVATTYVDVGDFVEGQVYFWGVKFESDGTLTIAVDGTADLTPATAGTDLENDTTLHLGSNKFGTYNGGGNCDITIYTGIDADWYKDTTWADPE